MEESNSVNISKKTGLQPVSKPVGQPRALLQFYDQLLLGFKTVVERVPKSVQKCQG